MTNSKKSIFLYNKRDELITYVDLDDSGCLTSYYHIDHNRLIRFTIDKFVEKNKNFTDINKAVIVFDEPCKLFHTFLDGESCCRAIKRDSRRIEPATVLSRICTHNDHSVEGYTIKPDLLQEWLKRV